MACSAVKRLFKGIIRPNHIKFLSRMAKLAIIVMFIKKIFDCIYIAEQTKINYSFKIHINTLNHTITHFLQRL